MSNNFEKSIYKGSKSTLCVGCGHDSVTANIISALHSQQIDPSQLVKLSGIGCSSKTPTYFASGSFGFNSIHGRMAPLATGVHHANPHLKIIGVSGDGDTASIGLGGFLHLLRRDIPMVYIVENNGVYGLTKGQFSATADKDTPSKKGELNLFEHFDLCALALEAGCRFVARSFSGDAKQLGPLLKAALNFNGTAFIDIVSPCIAFANHEGSTKSHNYVKENKSAINEVDFIEDQDQITADYDKETLVAVSDSHYLKFNKLAENHDVSSLYSAKDIVSKSKDKKSIMTGLFYLNKERKLPNRPTDQPAKNRVTLDEATSRLSKNDFDNIMTQYK